MSVSPSIQAIICEEVFDESSHPSIEGKSIVKNAGCKFRFTKFYSISVLHC